MAVSVLSPAADKDSSYVNEKRMASPIRTTSVVSTMDGDAQSQHYGDWPNAIGVRSPRICLALQS